MKEGVIKTIRLLCDYMKTKYVSKKHGGYNIFEDDKVRLCLDTYVWNIDVYVKKPNGEEVLVLSRSYAGYNQVYHPGKWEDHIMNLRDKALTAYQGEPFTPVPIGTFEVVEPEPEEGEEECQKTLTIS